MVPLEVAVPSPQLMVAVSGVGVLDSAIAPPGSVNFATKPVELTPRPAEKVRFPPLCTTAGSEIVAVLLTDTVEAPRVMLVLTVSEPAALNVWVPLIVKIPLTASKVMTPLEGVLPSPQLMLAE